MYIMDSFVVYFHDYTTSYQDLQDAFALCDISTSPLGPASEFLKKELSGKYILISTCPNGQTDFLSTTHFYVDKWHKYPEIC